MFDSISRARNQRVFLEYFVEDSKNVPKSKLLFVQMWEEHQSKYSSPPSSQIGYNLDFRKKKETTC